MSSYHSQNQQHTQKNVFKTTTKKPLRFAILGPHKSSKSAFVSIIANNISLENYYPTIQNSPILLQFQPQGETSRAILDINVSLKNLEDLHVLNDNDHYHGAQYSDEYNKKIELSKPLLNKINNRNIALLKKKHEHSASNPNISGLLNQSSECILSQTHNYYDLDYSNPDLFKDESFSPINSFHSPIASFSRGVSFGRSFTNSAGKQFPSGTSLVSLDNHESDNEKGGYRAPITTPILVELIDTPGVQKEDLIPFLEKSLDNRLARDVLSNLANEYNTNYRSRVKPLITGSGISDLNAAVDGYILFYSCVPEFEKDDSMPPPPMYVDDKDPKSDKVLKNEYQQEMARENSEGMESIHILESLHESIVEAWKEYNQYRDNWENGKEYDSHSISASFKQLWKNKDKNKEKSSKDLKNMETYIEQNLGNDSRPPIIIVCSHIDSPYAAPLLIKKGEKLARDWGCSFIQMSCAYDNDKWLNVEETLAIAVRESVEHQRSN